MKIEEIQKRIEKLGAEAWVMVDYENQHPVLRHWLGSIMLTRKLAVVIAKEGKPKIIAHDIDYKILPEDIRKEFELFHYDTWRTFLLLQKQVIGQYGKILMDISENGLLPRVSLADYGSVEYIKSLGVQVESSADLQQSFTSVLSPKSLQSQEKACEKALKIKDEAFLRIALDIKKNGSSDEFEIQQFICHRFGEEGMVYDEPPIVAIGQRASNPHYAPSDIDHSPIHEGDLVLIDMWAKFKEPGSVYADITWMGFVGEEVPAVYAERFEIVKSARDAAIAYLKENLPSRKVRAYELDDVARGVIAKAGFGQYFVHRLGHSIADGESPHGPGANLDNFETHDFRLLLENTSFSDEPGIYAPDFGVRSETDLQYVNGTVKVVGGLQDKIIPIMKLIH